MFKKLSRISLLLCFAGIAAMGTAQPSPQGATAGSVTLPVLGFVVDDAHRLRPVIGIAGSAMVGSPMDTGIDVLQASVPPAHEYILAITSNNNWPLLLQIRGGSIGVQAADGFVNQQQRQRSQ